MSFTDYERSYLAGQPLGRLATLAPDGSPQTRPVGFFLNDELGTVDIGGHNLGRSQKFHNIQLDGRVSFVVDDLASIDPWAPRGIEIRGEAEAIVDAEPPPSRLLERAHQDPSTPPALLGPRQRRIRPASHTQYRTGLSRSRLSRKTWPTACQTLSQRQSLNAVDIVLEQSSVGLRWNVPASRSIDTHVGDPERRVSGAFGRPRGERRVRPISDRRCRPAGSAAYRASSAMVWRVLVSPATSKVVAMDSRQPSRSSRIFSFGPISAVSSMSAVGTAAAASSLRPSR